MKLTTLLFASLLFLPNLEGQEITNFIALKNALKENGVYAPPKTYQYQVAKFDANGDTISTELVNMRIPSELNTETFEDGKVYFIWEYNSYPALEKELGPISRAFKEKDWVAADTTTMRFNDEVLYLHPMRENQYYQAEVAAHPYIKFTDWEDGKFQSKIVILKGFGKYNMQEYISQFEVKGKQSFNLKGEELDCYELVAKTRTKAFSFGAAKGKKNEVFGEKEIINTTTLLVNEKYGFVKIYYQFYDDESLIMEMLD